MAENNAMNVRIVDGDDCCPQAMCVKVCNLVQEVRKTGASKKLIPSEKAVSDALKGRQELLVAGTADGILGPSAATGLAQVLTAPSAGVSIVDAIKGRTLKWNQLVSDSLTFSGTGTITKDDRSYTIEDTTTSVRPYSYLAAQTMVPTIGHKYYIAFDFTAVTGTPSTVWTKADNNNNNTLQVSYSATRKRYSVVDENGTANGYFILGASYPADTTINAKFSNIVYIDLTLLFGSGNEPTTVAEFEALFPNFPYAYNAGTLLPYKGTGVKVTGFNQWDEQWEQGIINSGTGENGYSTSNSRTKGYIRVLEGETYYFKSPYVLYTRLYDINKNYISAGPNRQNSTYTVPSGVAYIRFVTDYPSITLGDICINLSNASLNGTYKPYTETLVNIDAIGKSAKDGDGNAIVPFPMGVNGDGTTNDEYDKEGGTLRWGVRAYEAGDESDATVITDGTNTVYPLDADVPFTWDEPFTLAFTAEEGGTIWLQPEGVDEEGVPVSAPLNADIAYTVPAGQVINATTLDNLLTAFKTAGIITAYTMTADGSGNYTFTITA